MYYSATLVLNNYIPLQIKEGMMFKNVLYSNTDREMIELWEIPIIHATRLTKSLDEMFTTYGYPVELSIIDGDGNTTLATSDQIGWWDEGECTDELRDITLKDINSILRNNGVVEIDISESAYNIGQIIPTIEEGKVILRYPIEDEEELDDLPIHNDSEEDENEFNPNKL